MEQHLKDDKAAQDKLINVWITHSRTVWKTDYEVHGDTFKSSKVGIFYCL